MAIGQSPKNPGRQSTFTCFDLQTPSDSDWAKPQKPRMLAEHASNTDHEVNFAPKGLFLALIVPMLERLKVLIVFLKPMFVD
jgi:hypothetical protein